MEQYRLIDSKRIKAVTSVGISYLDEDDFAQFIDFAECYANFVRERTAPDFWERLKKDNHKTDADWDWHLERLKRWREVGRKQPLTPPWAEGQYLELHTEPRIRFQCATVEEFGRVVGAVLKTKWKLMDLG